MSKKKVKNRNRKRQIFAPFPKFSALLLKAVLIISVLEMPNDSINLSFENERKARKREKKLAGVKYIDTIFNSELNLFLRKRDLITRILFFP